MKRAFGIDSSYHDIKFDPKSSECALDFAFLRTSYALTQDKIFLDSAKRCIDADLPWMVYHYLSTGVPWKEQVYFVLEIVSRVHGTPAAYWIDFEQAYNEMNMKFAIECSQAIQMMIQWVDQKVGLYTNNNLYNMYIAKSGDWHKSCPLWISWPINNYTSNLKPLLPDKRQGGDWQFWQYNYKGNGTKYGLGRSYAADLDVFNGTAKELAEWFGNKPAVPSEPHKRVRNIDTSWYETGNQLEIKNTVEYEN
jgi:GH25 family lysozyme M1 (1,4-beta-N-acetylmuramidase)